MMAPVDGGAGSQSERAFPIQESTAPFTDVCDPFLTKLARFCLKKTAIKNFSDRSAAVVLKDKVVLYRNCVDTRKHLSVQIDFLDGVSEHQGYACLLRSCRKI